MRGCKCRLRCFGVMPRCEVIGEGIPGLLVDARPVLTEVVGYPRALQSYVG